MRRKPFYRNNSIDKENRSFQNPKIALSEVHWKFSKMWFIAVTCQLPVKIILNLLLPLDRRAL